MRSHRQDYQRTEWGRARGTRAGETPAPPFRSGSRIGVRSSIRAVAMLFLLVPVAVQAGMIEAAKTVTDARGQVGVTKSYDPSYRVLGYPGGDVPMETGVCCDVIVRALRKQGLDLQKALHEDMKSNFSRYPQKWGLTKPDSNIDHRRVPNLQTWFKRQGYELPASKEPKDFQPGDVVAWDLGRGITHIGIVSDRASAGGVPLIIHNIGGGTQEEDILFRFTIIGRYRLQPKAAALPAP